VGVGRIGRWYRRSNRKKDRQAGALQFEVSVDGASGARGRGLMPVVGCVFVQCGTVIYVFYAYEAPPMGVIKRCPSGSPLPAPSDPTQ